MDRYRIEYFSQNDLSISENLRQIEKLLMTFNVSTFVKDINDILELYHIKKHIIDYDN